MQDKEFNDIVGEYSEALYWHIRGIVGSHEDADDVLQDTFVKIWRALPDFRGESAVSTWVWRIATNESLSFLRRKRVRAMLQFKSIDDEAERMAGGDPWFNGDEAQRKLSVAIAKLPDKQRAVFCMRYYEEMPYEEISAVTGTSVGALKASYHIAQEKIKEQLNLS